MIIGEGLTLADYTRRVTLVMAEAWRGQYGSTGKPEKPFFFLHCVYTCS